MLIEKAQHTAQRTNPWKISKVHDQRLLCIYNTCVGWIINILYIICWLQNSLFLSQRGKPWVAKIYLKWVLKYIKTRDVNDLH